MKKSFLIFTISFIIISSIYSQHLKVESYDPPITYIGNVDLPGTDYIVSSTEPFGKPSIIFRTTNNTIYASVPDTNILPGKCVVILSSTNNGANWQIINSVSPASIASKTKMVCRQGSDSVYCFMLIGSAVSCLNVITGYFNTFTNYTDIRDFDAVISSTNSLYLVADLNSNNDIRLFGSINSGSSWIQASYISSAAARPTMYMSSLGDTVMINWYASPFTDTVSSPIRNVMYRETTPGAMVTASTFTNIVPAGAPKDQFLGVKNGANVWLVYTEGASGSRDVKCIQSTNSGLTFSPIINIASGPNRDEYWFDAKHNQFGVNVIYYSDSLQAGSPTINSDKLLSTFAANLTPGLFTAPTQFNQHPMEFSSRGYLPALMEYYDAGGNAAAIYVGIDGANKRLFINGFNAITAINQNGTEIPEKFVLNQNYPNPFNPTTNVRFSIPLSRGVSEGRGVLLIVYDMLGREIATLVNEQLDPGIYEISWNASMYSSGIYFYKLISADYTETKRMVLIK
ncbi:MAG: T9SS type A sorting domain-containing protein [Ignavibacteria bacterium]|nr:T9SS type A sorting domain-containing protein [Ignavibacteria bacterium]